MAAFVAIARGAAAFVDLAVAHGQEEGVLVASGAYTATAQQEFAVVGCASVVAININTSAAGVSPSTVPTVEYFDPASQSWVVILTGVAITATGNITLLVGPHAANVANVAQNSALHGRMRINMTHGNGTSHTYSISASAS